MFKSAIVSAEQFTGEQRAPDEAVVNNVFKVLHGDYGTLFLSRYASGVLDERKRDLGVASARTVWAGRLREFPQSVVLAALDLCKTAHLDYPPNLPQFIALCKACTPRVAYRAEQPAIGMSQALRSQYAAKAREVNERHAQRAFDRITGFLDLPITLDGLKLAIANAVGTAGGDEAAELLRLDRLFERAPA